MAEKVTPKTTKPAAAKTTTKTAPKAAPKTTTKKATVATTTKKPTATVAPKKVEEKTVVVKTQPVKEEVKPAQSFTPVITCSTTRYKGIISVILGALVLGFMFLAVIGVPGESYNLIQYTDFVFTLTKLPAISSQMTTFVLLSLAASVVLILSVVSGLLMLAFGIPGILGWKKANKANFILSIIGLSLSLLAIVLIIIASTIMEVTSLGVAPILFAVCFSAYLIANVAFKLIAKR